MDPELTDVERLRVQVISFVLMLIGCVNFVFGCVLLANATESRFVLGTGLASIGIAFLAWGIVAYLDVTD